MKLLIVESPGKVKKIQSILGTGWKVAASVGHVRDLPEKELGVSLPDFKPDYAPTARGKDVLKRLAALVKTADAVYLATDPDREGEAIAWHLLEALKLKKPLRVTFGSITKSAIEPAINKPRSLDMALVSAQEARRVLDRLCGYLASGPLSKAAAERLSAGRVQSPALRLVVERERTIRDFVSTTHYGVELVFDERDDWKAAWMTKPWLKDAAGLGPARTQGAAGGEALRSESNGGEYLTDKALAEKAASLRSLTVADCRETESRAAPPAPFTTSTLQQAASNALKFSPKDTMALAQRLYEAGHCTYMRTDSPNLSDEAVKEIREYAKAKNLPLADKPRVWKSKDGAQEAHEAVRPTHIEVVEAGETEDEKALYRLIRIRALASQLADAVFAVRTLRLSAPMDGKTAEFEARGRTLLEPGWKTVLFDDDAADEGEAEPANPVPLLSAGDAVTASDGKVQIKKTKPPTRFTEASLVKELENRGIGRPATFAAIVETIMRREYVRMEKRQLAPTPLGEKATALLAGAFSFADYDFTRDMENSLDAIAGGKAHYRDVLAKAHERLQGELSSFGKAFGLTTRAAPEKTGFLCKQCGKPLVRRQSARGPFFGCSGYPGCKQLYSILENGKPDFGGK
jgi:DNA topoisomerase-1